MKTFLKILKWFGITLLLIVLVISGYVWSQQSKKWEAPYPDIHASKDSAVIANGKYLFYGPAHCIDCHGNRTDHPGMALNDLPPSGGFEFKLPVGTMCVPNITGDNETGIGKLTDGEIARTLRYGVGSDHRAIVDFMPFYDMSDEDLTAIISFVRTIAPEKKEVPRMQWNVLGKVVKAFLIKPVGPSGEIPKSVVKGPTVEYGKYLAHSVANCRGCHTNRDMMTGGYIGQDFAGGTKIESDKNPGKSYVSRNLTPDSEFGHIKDWTQDVFISRFHKGRVYEDSPMPWEAFKNFSDSDLTAIYKYLHTIKPAHSDPGPVIVTEELK
jgi:mono/diheme cytochrome c family protein